MSFIIIKIIYLSGVDSHSPQRQLGSKKKRVSSLTN